MSHVKCSFVRKRLRTSFKGCVVVATWVDVISMFHCNVIRCSTWADVVRSIVVRFVVGTNYNYVMFLGQSLTTTFKHHN